MSVFSTENQMEEMRQILYNYSKLPFSTGSIPGMLMESALAHAHGGVVLNTYDFVDVVDPGSRCGWQVKSTKAQTPITWKRAKIGDAPRLIDESRRSQGGLQRLGNTIIEFCNAHARESLDKYGLNEIGYARLILARDGTATYYERLLCDKDNPDIFDPSDFRWSWSTPKVTKRKEQLPALQGIQLCPPRNGGLGTGWARINCTSLANPNGGQTGLPPIRFRSRCHPIKRSYLWTNS